MSISALSTALCLPVLDIEALLQGRTIAAISDTFRNPSKFLLCPIDLPAKPGQLETRYQEQFLGSFKATYTSVEDPDAVMIHAWAKCKTCRIFSEKDNLAALSTLTAWTPEYLYELVQEKHKIFVLFLQIHRLAAPLKLMMPRLEADKINTYVRVPGSWSDQGATPLLDDDTFAKRQKQLVKLSPPIHPELQALQRELVFEREYSLGAMALDRDVRYFLGWSRPEETQLYDSDLSWIQHVAAAGCGSDEIEFKEMVRRSLVKLGFSEHQCSEESLSQPAAEPWSATINAEGSNAEGSNAEGSGVDSSNAEGSGVDGSKVYCTLPYPLVAECQSNQHSNVTNTVAVQLTRIGNKQFSEAQFEAAVKVIFAMGPLTEQAQQTAIGNRINVIRPDTLQKLTEIKARYPGAVDLLKLKTYLQSVPYGEAADTKVTQFVEETLFQLQIRAAVIQAVKTCSERTGQEKVGTDTVCGTYATLSQVGLPRLSVGEVQDILIELSSPVAGYLGRSRTDNGRTLFYFLRELSVEDKNLTAVTP
ncbi:MAG: DUF1802 family protein [Phormidesmis sp.]